MGYTTEFEGVLNFTSEMTAPALARLNGMLGEDAREHPEWGNVRLSYIDLELTRDFAGIQWDGGEKTYDLTEKVNLIIDWMRKEFPSFGLRGSLLAQGENAKDRWQLVIGQDGFAQEQEIKLAGIWTTCPHCNEEFLTPEIKA